MKRFFYNVKTRNNQNLQDYIMAQSVADAALKLERKGYIVLEIREDYDNISFNTSYGTAYNVIHEFTIQEKKEFFNALYHMYRSGIPIVETIKSISNSTVNINIKAFCRLLIKKLEKGNSLKDTLRNHSSYLGLAYTMLIAAGEESGTLDKTIEGIIKNINKQEEIKSSFIKSITWPALMFVLVLAVGLLFKMFVFKVLTTDIDLITTQNVIKLLIATVIKIIIFFIILFGAVFFILKNRGICSSILNTISGIKIFEGLMKDYSFSNFFYVFSLAYHAGVPLTEAIILSNSVVNIPKYNAKLRKSAQMVQNGCKVSTALAAADLFSSYAMSQISAGEEAGQMDKAFGSIAYDYENKLNTKVAVILKLIEPTMIIIIGIFVAILVIMLIKTYYGQLMSMI